MSLFKKYFSIIQEASYSSSEKRGISSSIENPDVFCYLIDENNNIIETIMFNEAKNMKFSSFLLKLKENDNIDKKSKENILSFLKKSDDLINIKQLFDVNFESIKILIDKAKKDSSIGNVIGKIFSGDPAPFIKGYQLITPKKLVSMAGKQIIQKLETPSTKKVKKTEPKQKSISSSIDDKFYKVLSSVLNFNKDQINEILKDNKVSEMRARTMNIGYFFDEVNSKAFEKYGYYMVKVGDEILFSKNKPSYDMNTSIKSLKLNEDQLKMLIFNTLSEAEEEDKVVDEEEILSMTLRELGQAFPNTLEKFLSAK